MQRINWNQFRLKNPDHNEAFEELCYHLFCRKYKITEGIRTDFNQTGLETYPIDVNGELTGFQSKFFDNKLSDSSSTKQINESIAKAIKSYQNLKKIILYTHQSLGSRNPKYKQDIEKKAGSIKVEWVVKSNLDIILNQPTNLDLLQLYFGYGDEYGFLRESSNKDQTTLVNSAEYRDLPLDRDGTKKIKDLAIENSKVSLLLGNPGSGKSVLMYRLFQTLGGLDKKSLRGMKSVLSKNKALPMLINLKDCSSETLENIIRNRLSDYKLNHGSGNSFKMVYLFDGLDELDEQTADRVLSYICILVNGVDTSKVIISCRSGNLNRLKAKEYLNLIEYRIKDIVGKQLDGYFKAKGDLSKIEKLKQLKKNNPYLVDDINDIFLVKLLWDTIDELGAQSTVIDLFDKKIKLLLTDPRHKKYLVKLNLLNPKDQTICSLNQVISLEFQKKYQFRISHSDLQKIILSQLPRVDYNSVNDIINYLLDLFFNSSLPGPGNDGGSYAYQHRRYQEFFFAKKLKGLYETTPAVLRDLKVLSNHEFFYDIFLKYLKKEYLKNRDLSRLLEIDLINVYSGKHRGWGADDPYYVNSSEFIPSLACQRIDSLEQLMEDESLDLKSKILIDINYLKEQFGKWKRDKKSWRTNDYLKSVWGSGVSELINHLRTFNSYGKNRFADEIRKNLQSIQDLYKKNKFLEQLDPKDVNKPSDPYWTSIESWIYFRAVIKKENLKNIFESLIRANYKYLSDTKQFSTEESSKEKLIKSFFRICIKDKIKGIASILSLLDEFEWLALLEILLGLDNVPLIFRNNQIKRHIKTFITNYKKETNESTYFVPFYRRVFKIPLTESDLKFGESELEKYRKERHFEWHMYNIPFKYSLVSYSLGKDRFGSIKFDTGGRLPNYYNELQLYSLMFDGYIELLKNKIKINSLLRDYKRYVASWEVVGQGLYLKAEISFLWSYVFKYSNYPSNDLQVVKADLFREGNNVLLFSFYLRLKEIDSSLFNRLANESEIKIFEDELLDWKDDYPSYIDRCFYLGQFYSDINPQRAIIYISKGINDGVLRHGWRKDPIVSYFLVDALEILWRNNYLNKESLVEWSKKIFEMTLRVADITDGAGTWSGPYNMVKLISRYDLELASSFKDKVIEHSGYYNFSNSVITYILLAKVELGVEVEKLEELMREYRNDYDYERKPKSDYYEEKLKVYMAVSQSESYSKKIQKQAFEKAHALVNEVVKREVSYFLNITDNREERIQYESLCRRFKKDVNLPRLEGKTDEYKRKQGIPEKDFVRRIKNAKTSRQLRMLIKKLSDYDQRIELKKFESWDILVKKTFDIEKSITKITDYLKEQSYPHTDFYTTNSRYLHFCVASALKELDTRDQMLDYLFENGGHGGFINIMRSYEVNGDKEMCVTLFEHFYNFCRFLVY